MTGETWGLIGGIGGAVIGLAGGAFGTWCSIRNTCGPRERAFVIRASAACWLGIALFLLLVAIVPDPYRWLLWVPYALLLPVGILRWNSVQRRIRQEEAAASSPAADGR